MQSTNDPYSNEQIKRLISSHLQGYCYDLLNVQLLPGGLTNQTCKVTCQSKQSLIFRGFSPVVDRDIDNQIFKSLQEANIAPKCYYANSDFRIQQFVQNASHPSSQQLRNEQTRKKVLQLMFKYHGTEIQVLKNKPLLIEQILSQTTFQNIKKHRESSNEQNFQDLYNQIKDQYHKIEELKILFAEQSPVQARKKVRFCHNDLNNLNIFSKPCLMFIDYEYSSYNYFYYDIANFLNESTINYQVKEFPFFRNEAILTLQQIQKASKMYPQTYPGLERDIIKGLVACNLYWAGWSIIMANDPTQKNFGAVQHGQTRMKLFRHYLSFL